MERLYCIFSVEKQGIILNELGTLPNPKPFFNFQSKSKIKEYSNIPTSNTDSSLTPIFRSVWVFESIFTNDFPLLSKCKENSEWWWNEASEAVNRLNWFLSQSDAITVGKSKEELDALYNE